MVARNISCTDALSALAVASRCYAEPSGDVWRVIGPAIDGRDCTFMVKQERGVLVIAIY